MPPLLIMMALPLDPALPPLLGILPLLVIPIIVNLVVLAIRFVVQHLIRILHPINLTIVLCPDLLVQVIQVLLPVPAPAHPLPDIHPLLVIPIIVNLVVLAKNTILLVRLPAMLL